MDPGGHVQIVSIRDRAKVSITPKSRLQYTDVPNVWQAELVVLPSASLVARQRGDTSYKPPPPRPPKRKASARRRAVLWLVDGAIHVSTSIGTSRGLVFPSGGASVEAVRSKSSPPSCFSCFCAGSRSHVPTACPTHALSRRTARGAPSNSKATTWSSPPTGAGASAEPCLRKCGPLSRPCPRAELVALVGLFAGAPAARLACVMAADEESCHMRWVAAEHKPRAARGAAGTSPPTCAHMPSHSS